MDKQSEKLLQLLNKEFGFPDAKTATYKKVKQYYDEKKNQHIIYIELRISRNEVPVSRDSDFKQSQRLLHNIINARKTKNK